MANSMEMRLRQQLALTPQLQQALRLLQLSSLELEEEISRALATNPLLEESSETEPEPRTSIERSSEAPVEDFAADHAEEMGQAADSFPSSSHAHDEDDADWTEWSGAESGLRDHLRNQLLLSQMPDRERALAHLLIDALDEDGYLRVGLEDLLQLVPVEYAVDIEELGAVLRLVQTLEPAGVAARSLEECLRLQLLGMTEDTPGLRVAREIVDKLLPLLARCEFGKLQRLTGCDAAELAAAQALIRSLDPKPGLRFGVDDTRYVVPDVIVSKVRGRWSATLNPAVLPRVRLNRAYAAAISGRAYAGTQMSQQLQEARWLMRSMEQRFATIQRVADAIVAKQRRFLEFGEVAMRPLTMKQIAAELDLHESTVCRTVSGKYMATPRGVYEFKHFFSRQLATASGGACSAAAVRALLKELIASEDPRQPLSDAKLAQLLGEQGLQVARRTVSKYRNLLRLPKVELRQSYQSMRLPT